MNVIVVGESVEGGEFRYIFEILVLAMVGGRAIMLVAFGLYYFAIKLRIIHLTRDSSFVIPIDSSNEARLALQRKRVGFSHHLFGSHPRLFLLAP